MHSLFVLAVIVLLLPCFDAYCTYGQARFQVGLVSYGLQAYISTGWTSYNFVSSRNIDVLTFNESDTLACPIVNGSLRLAESRGFPNGGGGLWASKSGLWFAGGSNCQSAAYNPPHTIGITDFFRRDPSNPLLFTNYSYAYTLGGTIEDFKFDYERWQIAGWPETGPVLAAGAGYKFGGWLPNDIVYTIDSVLTGGTFDSIWNTSMRLGLARSNLQAARVGNYILFVGGSTIGNYSGSVRNVDIYSRLTNSMINTSANTSRYFLNAPRYQMRSVVIGDSAYFIGGQDHTGAMNTFIHVFNSTTLTWTHVPLNTAKCPARTRHGVASIGGQIFIMGGVTNATSNVHYGQQSLGCYIDTTTTPWTYLNASEFLNLYLVDFLRLDGSFNGLSDLQGTTVYRKNGDCDWAVFAGGYDIAIGGSTAASNKFYVIPNPKGCPAVWEMANSNYKKKKRDSEDKWENLPGRIF